MRLFGWAVLIICMGTLCDTFGADEEGNSISAVETAETLSGDLPPVLKNISHSYLVVGTITIPAGASTKIEPGVILRFKNFTGLQVFGTLHAKGTQKNPIIFTSEHDNTHGAHTDTDPAPYDWNGITIGENALGTALENCTVRYSLFGINVLSEHVVLKECTFHQNGRADITINNIKHETGGLPYSYQPPSSRVIPSVLNKAMVDNRRGKNTLQVLSVSLFLGGTTIGCWKALSYRTSNNAFNRIDDISKQDNLKNPGIMENWESAKKNRDNDLLVMGAGFGVGLLGLITFTFTLFKKKGI